ncbi:MAG: hypothetical protein MK102_04860 [Fuerstiella sp.]|nr:hypothetical protein [Fuerstiella sp.]
MHVHGGLGVEVVETTRGRAPPAPGVLRGGDLPGPLVVIEGLHDHAPLSTAPFHHRCAVTGVGGCMQDDLTVFRVTPAVAVACVAAGRLVEEAKTLRVQPVLVHKVEPLVPDTATE